jgi:hypothetical protein
MRHRALVIGLLAAAIAGCGADEHDTTAEAPSRLVIHEQRAAGGLMYREGSLGFLRVAPVNSGTDLDATEVPTAAPGAQTTIFDERLEPGEYRIVSYQRPCDGNCGYLDPPTDRCATTLQLGAGETREITIYVQPGRDCRVAAATLGG